MSKKTSLAEGILVDIVHKTLDDHKAEDIVTINLSGKTTFADYMVIASGTSQRHLKALAHYLHDEVLKKGHKYVQLEGTELTDWILVDLGNVIVHLFKPEARQTYDLESMWDHNTIHALRQLRG